MPQIPRYKHRAEYPGVPVTSAFPAAVPKAAAEIGELILNIAERDRNAEIQKQALKAGNAIRDEQDIFAESLSERNDYENFVNDVDKWEKNAREKYQPLSRISDGSESPKLANAIDATISSRTNELKRLARDKARVMMVNEAKGEWIKSQMYYAKDYAAEENLDRRAAIKNSMEIEARELAGRGILWPQEAETDIQQFGALVAQTMRRNARAQAKEAVYRDPETALELLADKDMFSDLHPEDRTELMEHAEVRIRTEGTRRDKLTKIIQNENRARTLDDYAAGKLDLDRLKEYRQVSLETGQRGLSDEFFTSMLEKLKQGKDVDKSDSDVFNRLYLKDNLTWNDIDKESSKLAQKDIRVLMNRVLSEGREEAREKKAVEREEAKEKKSAEALEKQRRNAYAAVAKKFLTKAMNETGVDADEGVEILRTFQGYIDDRKIAAEDLPTIAEKLMESHKGGVIKWIKGVLGIEKQEELPPPEGIPKRKSLDEIFGGKKP